MLTGACALVLCVTPVAARAESPADPAGRLARHVESIRKESSVVRFFHAHPWLLEDPRYAKVARARLTTAERRVAASRARLREEQARLERRRDARERTRRLQSLAASPRRAICHVFGRYCGQALAVASCESGIRTTARNGQYHGMFQMGSSERRLFGHGDTPLQQARAAYRYFVRSGRDWSPWTCKP